MPIPPIEVNLPIKGLYTYNGRNGVGLHAKHLLQETIKETFTLTQVPREAYVLGLGGTIPYLATSLATVFCSYEIQRTATHATGVLLNGSTAEAWLQHLEPLQVGYGAVVCSVNLYTYNRLPNEV